MASAELFDTFTEEDTQQVLTYRANSKPYSKELQLEMIEFIERTIDKYTDTAITKLANQLDPVDS